VAGGDREMLPYYYDTHSHTVKNEMILIMLNIVALLDMEIRVIDVTAAFLEASLSRKDEVLVRMIIQWMKVLNTKRTWQKTPPRQIQLKMNHRSPIQLYKAAILLLLLRKTETETTSKTCSD
jgi:hypothetical protein